MSNSERSEALNPTSPDRLSVYTGLLQNISTLMAELEANKAADQTEGTFTFELIDENEIMIPRAVRDILPGIDQITATIGKVEEGTPSYLSITFSSPDKDVIISRSGLDESAYTPDVVIDTSLRQRIEYKPDGTPYSSISGEHQLQNEAPADFADRQSDLGNVSLAELNALVMSLAHPNPDRLYAQFDEANFLNPAAHDVLRDFMELTALNNQDSNHYKFSTDGATLFSFIKKEGQPISFEITYPDKQLRQMITAQSDFEADFKITFSTLDATLDNPYYPGEKEFVRTPYLPSTSEVSYLLSLVKTEIAALHPINLATPDIEVAGNDHPDAHETATEDPIVFSNKYIEGVLNQLGFDSPDSRAT